MAASPLVSCQWLKDHMTDPEVRVLDCHYTPGSKEYTAEYSTKHIPGAVHFDMEKASYKSDVVIRELLTPDHFDAYVKPLGVSNGSHVVVYDHSGPTCGFFSSARAYWLFKLYGHDNVSILDGGMQKWVAMNFPTTADVTNVAQVGDFRSEMNKSVLANFDEFFKGYNEKSATIVDARPAKQFSGEEKISVACLPGCYIPSTINLPSGVYVKDGVAKRGDDLKRVVNEAGVDLTKPIITFCNSGMQSCASFFFCSLAGCENVKNYNGALPEIGKIKPEMVNGIHT